MLWGIWRVPNDMQVCRRAMWPSADGPGRGGGSGALTGGVGVHWLVVNVNSMVFENPLEFF